MSSIERSVYRNTEPEPRAAPDQLDALVTLTPFHYWLWLIAIVVVVVVIAVWGFVTAAPMTVEHGGILTHSNQQPEAITYVDAEQAGAIELGMPARATLNMTGEVFEGAVTRVALAPTTPEEAAAITGEAPTSGEAIYEIRLTLNSAVFTEGAPCEISIVTGEMRPISRALLIFS